MQSSHVATRTSVSLEMSLTICILFKMEVGSLLHLGYLELQLLLLLHSPSPYPKSFAPPASVHPYMGAAARAFRQSDVVSTIRRLSIGPERGILHLVISGPELPRDVVSRQFQDRCKISQQYPPCISSTQPREVA